MNTPNSTPSGSTRVSFENILFATDFSAISERAFPYAVAIARKYGAKIFVAHVVSVSPMPNSTPTLTLQELAAQAVREAKESMASFEARWKDVPHQTLIRRGEIWNTISDLVEENDIDLIICGTHGRRGVSKLLMGSVAEKIFRHAACPVLTVGPSVCGEIESIVDIHEILCPVDFTAESLAAVPHAISLAQEDQARLYLLNVTAGPVSAAAEDDIKNRLQALVPEDARLWCEPRVFVDSGNATDRILALADELAVDLLVLGTKGAGRLAAATTRLAMTTASTLISRAACPVLTIRGAA